MKTTKAIQVEVLVVRKPTQGGPVSYMTFKDGQNKWTESAAEALRFSPLDANYFVSHWRQKMLLDRYVLDVVAA